MQCNRLDPRKIFGAAVFNEAKKNQDIVVLSADSGKSSGFAKFKETYPDRYYEFGIMEQGVVGIASGLATVGKIPIFCAIAPFVTSRPFEMLRNDIGYMNQNVKIVGRNSGISYSNLGATHHALDDFGIVRMIPGITIIAPQDPNEIESAVEAMLAHNGPVYMRIGNDPIPCLFEKKKLEVGRGRVICDGDDATIITTGSISENTLNAVKILGKRNIGIRLVGMPTVVPADKQLIEDSARKTGKIITVEEHYEVGGLGTIVQEICSETYPVPIMKLAIPHIYASSGPFAELLAHYELDAQSIANRVEKFLS
jgi:transketolase